MEMGPGLIGNVREVYTLDFPEHPHLFKYDRNTLGIPKYQCFESDFIRDPHFLKGG